MAYIIISIAAVVIITAVFAGAFALLKFAVFRKKDGGTDEAHIIREKDPDSIKERKKWYYVHEKEFEKVTITSSDSVNLCGFILKAEKSSEKTVILVHGYTSNHVQEWSPFVKFYHELGFNILAVDLRAHGESGGKYITYGIYDRKDCKQWVEFAEKRFGGDIYLHGISMGCSTALMALGEKLPDSVRGVVADCGYTSPYAQFVHVMKLWFHLPPFPMLNVADFLCGIICKWRFKDCDTRDIVARTDKPILFIHGKNDSFVIPQMSIENYNACASRKKLVLVDGAGHAQSYYASPEKYENEICTFFGF